MKGYTPNLNTATTNSKTEVSSKLHAKFIELGAIEQLDKCDCECCNCLEDCEDSRTCDCNK